MNRETLIAEMGRLLDAGEPLLTMFETKYPDYWALELPDNISDAMNWYAYDVALRAWDQKKFRDDRLVHPTQYLADVVAETKAGLLGWRAIGVLK